MGSGTRCRYTTTPCGLEPSVAPTSLQACPSSPVDPLGRTSVQLLAFMIFLRQQHLEGRVPQGTERPTKRAFGASAPQKDPVSSCTGPRRSAAAANSSAK